MADKDVQKTGKGVMKFVLLASLLSFTAGGAAGVLAWQKLNPADAAQADSDDHDSKKNDVLPVYETHANEMSLGRIVVTLASTGESGEQIRRLLVEPVIVYEGAAAASGKDEKKDDGHGKEGEKVMDDPVSSKRSQIRDAYIEYMSQLTVEEVQGSHAIMKIKADLLRRARLETESDLPEEILMNEFLVQ